MSSKRAKKKFRPEDAGFFPTEYIRICRLLPPPFPLRSSHERCAQCWIECKINFKIFPIIVFFKLWLTIFTIYGATPDFSSVSPTKIVQKWPNSQEICSMSWNEWKINFQIFPTFSFWYMVDFVLKFRIIFMLGGFAP